MKAALASAAAALIAPSVEAAVTATLLVHDHSTSAWFGDSAIAMQSPSDPIFMTSTWVYPPTELLGFRPATNTSWKMNTTQEFKYQTLYVTSTGVPAKNGAVDSLAWWSQKPDGIAGNCYLVGFNSATAPDVDSPKAGQWKSLVGDEMACLNINGWVPFTWMALDDAGQTAVAWFEYPDGENFGIFAYDGQTGKLRWNNTVKPSSPPPQGVPVVSYGVSISRDGRYVITDSGLDGMGLHTFWIFNAADGSLKTTVTGAALLQSFLSPTGDYIFTQNADDEPEATVHRWNASSGKYESIGTVRSPKPQGAPSNVAWYLSDGSFGYDATSNRTVLALAWLTSDLSGHQSVSVWDVTADLKAGPITNYTYTGDGSTYAVDGQAVKCTGLVCAAALWNQKTDEGNPTVLVFDASAPAGTKAGPVWTFATAGSMESVDVALGTTAAGTPAAFVAAAGCDTFGVCVAPGGDAYLWMIEGL